MKTTLVTRALTPTLVFVIWLLLPQTCEAFYNPSTGRWLNRDRVEERGGSNLYGSVGNNSIDKCDVLGLTIAGPTASKCQTRLFSADAYSVLAAGVTVGYTSPWFVGFGGGYGVEIVYNCRSHTAGAFINSVLGITAGTPGPSVTVAKGGLNIINNLPSVEDYKGHFVAATGGYVSGIGIGGYGTVFSTPKGLLDLIRTGSTSGTWGFGAGPQAGIPGFSALFSWNYFWLMGSVPFSNRLFEKICKCCPSPEGSLAEIEPAIREEAVKFVSEHQFGIRSSMMEHIPSVFPTGYRNELSRARFFYE